MLDTVMNRKFSVCFVVVAICMAALCTGCGSGPEELYETAELEVLQNSHANAERLFRQVIERCIAPEAGEFVVARIERIDGAGKAAGSDVRNSMVADGVWTRGCADNRNRCRPQKGIESVRHLRTDSVASPFAAVDPRTVCRRPSPRP